MYFTQPRTAVTTQVKSCWYSTQNNFWDITLNSIEIKWVLSVFFLAVILKF